MPGNLLPSIIYLSLLNKSLIQPLSAISSRQESYLFAMMLSDIDLNFDKSFTTSEPKNVEPSSSVGSYTITLAPLALIPSLI